MIKQITIDGKNYNLDITAALAAKVLAPVYVPHKIGDYFKLTSVGLYTDHRYILTTFDNRWHLVDIDDGNRWSSVVVTDSHGISESEWKLLCSTREFVKVKLNITEIK